MKILICTGIYPPEAGGPATYSKLLAGELGRRGHEVSVITYSEAGVGRPESGVGVARIPRSWFKPWHYYKYFQAVKRLGKHADIFYAQDPVSAGYPTYLAARVLKKPYAVKVTGDYSWEQAACRGKTTSMIDDFQKERHFGVINLMRRIQIRVCKEAHLVITPAEYLKRLVMGWGVKEKKIRVIRNAAPAVPKIEKTHHDDFRVVSVGRDVPWKGFAVLREAARELKSEIPTLTLEILHAAPRETVMRQIASADIFVLNSAYEGISHVTLEAMALGTPVIITNIGGNPEIVQDGASGLLVNYNDKEQLKTAIKKLYANPELRQRLSASARQSISRSGREAMVSDTEKELQTCVS